jgi:hypothetical protein
VPTTERWDGSEVEIGISPLFHMQFATGEFVLGPSSRSSGTSSP